MGEAIRVDPTPLLDVVRTGRDVAEQHAALALLQSRKGLRDTPAVKAAEAGLRGHADAEVRRIVGGWLDGAPAVAPQAWRDLPEGHRWVEPRFGMELQWVPPGPFWMGSSREEGHPRYDADAFDDRDAAPPGHPDAGVSGGAVPGDQRTVRCLPGGQPGVHTAGVLEQQPVQSGRAAGGWRVLDRCGGVCELAHVCGRAPGWLEICPAHRGAMGASRPRHGRAALSVGRRGAIAYPRSLRLLRDGMPRRAGSSARLPSTPKSTRLRQWAADPPGRAPVAQRTWRAMSGSGAKTTGLTPMSTLSTRLSTHVTTCLMPRRVGWCGAARGASLRGTCAARSGSRRQPSPRSGRPGVSCGVCSPRLMP